MRMRIYLLTLALVGLCLQEADAGLLNRRCRRSNCVSVRSIRIVRPQCFINTVQSVLTEEPCCQKNLNSPVVLPVQEPVETAIEPTPEETDPVSEPTEGPSTPQNEPLMPTDTSAPILVPASPSEATETPPTPTDDLPPSPSTGYIEKPTMNIIFTQEIDWDKTVGIYVHTVGHTQRKTE